MTQKPRLIAVDFDGTVASYKPIMNPDPAFLERIRPLITDGVLWALNSDRSFRQQERMALDLEEELRPCALLCRQREIYLYRNGIYEAHMEWNAAMQEAHVDLWKQLRPFFAAWTNMIEENFEVLEKYVDDEAFAFMLPQDETDSLRESMNELLMPWPEATVSGNADWVFVQHSSFSKGRVLGELADMLNLPRELTLAIGDGLNDVGMLNGSVTPLVGCPANSCMEVKEAVGKIGGKMADGEDAAGTVEVIDYYFRNS
ncbi:MAG: HAD family phosphatase [Planctomycetes bacterium]|nr:HAD family phosphatase [Planctomycetota bacterium]